MSFPLRPFLLRPLAALVMTLPGALVIAAPLDFDLPAQPLETSIKAIAKAAGLNLVVDGRLLAGKSAPAVKGRFEAEEALRRALTGSGLSARLEDGSAVVSEAAGDKRLKEVLVIGDPLGGSADAGYRVESNVTTGPWGKMAAQDTPYSINTLSAELLENRIAASSDQVFAASPSTQLNLNQSRGYGSIIYMRGLRLTNDFTQVNGMRVAGNLIMPLEDKERVETLSGLSGFLYGAGNVGGTVNYVTKRPTEEQFTRATVGNYGGQQYFTHVDTGGRFDAQGNYGYRFNFAASHGNTAVDDNNTNKWMGSGAFDFKLSDKLLLQVDYAHQHYHEKGTQADWGSFGGSFKHFDPDLLDPGKYYGQKWTYNKNDMDIGGARLQYDLSAQMQVRAAYQRAQVKEENVYSGNNVSFDGSQYTYSLTAVRNAPRTHTNDTGYAFVDYSFDLGPVRNKLTAGYSANRYELTQHQDSFQFIGLGNYAVQSSPTYVAAPNFTNGVLPNFTAQRTFNESWLLGDVLTFDEQWSALLGLNWARIDTTNYNANGSTASAYDKRALTPSLSLIYKPMPWLSTYGTYIESLQDSGTASATFNSLPVTNGGQGLKPIISDQYEIGTKAQVGGTLLTAALFQINKANTYYSPNGAASYTYSSDGEQRHRGLEFTATGKLTERLVLVGGVTFIDTKVTKTNTVYQKDAPPYGAAKRLAKLYAEYNLPFVPGLTLTGGINHVGPQLSNAYAWPDPSAQEWLPAYTTFDLGARYATQIAGKRTVLRLNVANVANRSYWQQSEVTGLPRTVGFSASMDF